VKRGAPVETDLEPVGHYFYTVEKKKGTVGECVGGEKGKRLPTPRRRARKPSGDLATRTRERKGEAGSFRPAIINSVEQDKKKRPDLSSRGGTTVKKPPTVEKKGEGAVSSFIPYEEGK